jgi:hypothetical protein
MGNHLVVLQAEDPDGVPAQYVIPDQPRSFFAVELEAHGELACVLDLRLAPDGERTEPIPRLALLVHELDTLHRT